MVLLVLYKCALFTWKNCLLHITKDNSILLNKCVMLIAYLPTSGIQNPGHFPKFPGFYQISLDKSIESSICYLNIRMQK